MALQKRQVRREFCDLKEVDGAYPPGLHRYLTRQLRNQDDASDLAQEAFLRYLQSPDLAAIERRDHYIFRIALNLISEWRHRRDRAKKIAAKVSALELCAEGGVRDTVEVIESERLQKILDAIPEKYRRVLWMIKVEEKSYIQVATELHLAPKTVLIYLGRAVLAARQAGTD